ncbi:carotenoid oxygenase family protein [Variovorax sp. J22P168]|uniref:carotenoid oxygenase family protein n=1 Tax=Variovorax jilinensis TaxID=3053513 RepID=UPI002575CA13|nr:carotenoid oxygenase family protein [Variovorax sp. J22P168]MDM0014473.1 carotenoid oxygenase family protein [Variovorax sp. J22P168]
MNEATPRRSAPPPSMSPIDFETDVGPLPLQGRLPEGLAGTLVRNGPNPAVPDPKAHWFVGDGMLHAFRIEDGQVRYRNRWVLTSRLAYARRTGHNPVTTPGAPQPGGEPFPVDDGAANTNVIRHAGRMLALEEAHLPIAVDLATLETLGVDDFRGGVQGRVTAHPKTDPSTGELLFFGYGTPESLSSGMSFGVVSPAGEVLRQEFFEAPYASMVHDFAVTANHVLFPVMPLTASRERAESGRPPFAWEPGFGTRVGLMPRAGSTADIVWWSGPAAYVFHVMNAWDEPGRVCVDVMQFARPPLFPLPDGSPASDGREPAQLVRWQFDLADPGRRFTQTVLEEIPGEFPRIDERRAGLPYRHGWFAGHAPGDDGELRMQSRLVHVDHAAPRADVYTFEGRDRISEPVFVARSPDSAEGDGWILAVAWRAATDTSDLVVFDARNVAAGPLCVASLPHRVPDGFHGNWFGVAG